MNYYEPIIEVNPFRGSHSEEVVAITTFVMYLRFCVYKRLVDNRVFYDNFQFKG